MHFLSHIFPENHVQKLISFEGENYFNFVQSKPSIQLVLFQTFTMLGTVPKTVTPAS